MQLPQISGAASARTHAREQQPLPPVLQLPLFSKVAKMDAAIRGQEVPQLPPARNQREAYQPARKRVLLELVRDTDDPSPADDAALARGGESASTAAPNELRERRDREARAGETQRSRRARAAALRGREPRPRAHEPSTDPPPRRRACNVDGSGSQAADDDGSATETGVDNATIVATPTVGANGSRRAYTRAGPLPRIFASNVKMPRKLQVRNALLICWERERNSH
jgi:hypothetical protein